MILRLNVHEIVAIFIIKLVLRHHTRNCSIDNKCQPLTISATGTKSNRDMSVNKTSHLKLTNLAPWVDLRSG